MNATTAADHHDETDTGLAYLHDQLTPHPSATAHDDVAGETRDLTVHSASPEDLFEAPFEQHLDEDAECVQRRADAEHHDDERDDPIARRGCVRSDFVVADRRDGDDRLVQRVEGAETFEHVRHP